MTRLRESDINLIVRQMKEYNEELVRKTGHTLSDIAAHAVGMHCTDVHDPGPIAVLPMTCGQGVISGFSETVAGILRFLGMSTFVPSSTDAKGFAEALERGASRWLANWLFPRIPRLDSSKLSFRSLKILRLFL